MASAHLYLIFNLKMILLDYWQSKYQLSVYFYWFTSIFFILSNHQIKQYHMHAFTAKCVLHSLCNSFRYIKYFDDLQINVNSVRQIHLTFLIHKSHKLSIKNVNKRVEH